MLLPEFVNEIKSPDKPSEVFYILLVNIPLNYPGSILGSRLAFQPLAKINCINDITKGSMCKKKKKTVWRLTGDIEPINPN